MYGDSPWDYMSDEEKEQKTQEWEQADKLRKEKAEEKRLLALREYSSFELRAELERRSYGA